MLILESQFPSGQRGHLRGTSASLRCKVQLSEQQQSGAY